MVPAYADIDGPMASRVFGVAGDDQREIGKLKGFQAYVCSIRPDLPACSLACCAFHRITAAGHKDKALEYGKDVWMKYILPTQHVLYFGIQAKKGKLDASGMTKGENANIAEIYNQVVMMLGHEVFDPEIGKRVLVDHAFIVAGGEITKQARNWLGNKLDATKRSQVMFMDREES